MQAFLDQVVKGLVEHPDAVAITEVEQERTTVYELRLAPTDVGRIIGKSGRTINAIRSLMQAGSAKAGKFTRLEVIDEKDDAADEGTGVIRPRRPGRNFFWAAMKIDVLTLFPGMFPGPLDESIIKRACDSGRLRLGTRARTG